MVWIKILIYLSTLLATTKIVLSIGSRYNKEGVSYSTIFYLLGTILFISQKDLFYPKELFLCVGVLYFSINLHYIEWVLKHLGYIKKVRVKMSEYLGNAKSVTWESLKALPINESVSYPFATTKKLSEAPGKMAFESKLKPNNTFYFSDFSKQYHVLDGDVIVKYRDGREEVLTKDSKTEIAPFEIHQLITDSCNMLVTCIN